MKRTSIIFTVFIWFMILTFSVSASEEEWVCPSCGETVTGNYCSNCGEAKPSEEWICPSCGETATGNFCRNCGTGRNENKSGAEKSKIDSTAVNISETVPDDSRTLSFLDSLSEQERSIRGFYKHEADEDDFEESYVIEIEPIGSNEVVIISGFYEDLLGNIVQSSLSSSYFNTVSLDEIIHKDSESVLWDNFIYTRTTDFDSYYHIISDGIIRDYYLQHFEGSLIEDAKYHIDYDLKNGFKYTFQNEEFIYPNAVALGHVIIEDPEDPNSLWWGITEPSAMFGTKDGFMFSEELLVDISYCLAADYAKFVDDGMQFITGDHIIEEEELAVLQEPTEWRLAYQDFVRDNTYLSENGYYLLKWGEDGSSFFCHISLLYIDEDDIPEMVIGLYKYDNLVVSWKPTGLVASIVPRSRITGYIEKGNSFYRSSNNNNDYFFLYHINNTGMIEASVSGGRRLKVLTFDGFYLNDSVVSKSECRDALREYYPKDKRRTYLSESFYGYDTFLSF